MTRIQSVASGVIEELRFAKSQQQIMEALSRLVVSIGFSKFQMSPGPFNPLPEPKYLLDFGNFDIELKEIYSREINSIYDPVRKIALNQSSPVHWRKIFLKTKNPKEREFIVNFRNFGLYDGISIPIHGPNGCVALLMLGSNNSFDLKTEDEEALSLVAIIVLQRIKRIAAAALFPKSTNINLTEREKECLTWVLEGKTNWEIGVLMGVAARTVQFHLANCARKMGVHNRIQAAVRALMAGIINPPSQIGIDKKMPDNFDKAIVEFNLLQKYRSSNDESLNLNFVNNHSNPIYKNEEWQII